MKSVERKGKIILLHNTNHDNEFPVLLRYFQAQPPIRKIFQKRMINYSDLEIFIELIINNYFWE